MQRRYLKKITAGLICAATLVSYASAPVNSIFPDGIVTVNAAYQLLKNSAVEWELDSNGTLTLSGHGSMPDFWYDNGNCPWYNDRKEIKSIVIGSEIDYIGDNAFRDCSNAVSVSIPNSVKGIGERAFKGCSSLASIHLPLYLNSIGSGAFWGTAIEEITVAGSVTAIESRTFSECPNLKTVHLSDAITRIEITSFSGCKKLETVNMPESLVSIGQNAFESCYKLEITSFPDSLTTINDQAFQDCKSITELTFGSGIKTIGNLAFYGCPLTKVSIPDGVDIAAGAFADCMDIKFDSDIVVELKGGNVECESGRIEWSYFNDGTLMITGNGKMKDKETYADYTCPWSPLRNNIKKVIVGDGVQNLRKSAFKTSETLEEVVLGNSVKYIGTSAFSGCSNLKSINFPEGLETIRSYAFYGCEVLDNVKLPSTLTTLEEVAFYCCYKLQKIDIPDGVTTIGKHTFHGCNALNSITLPKNLTYLGEFSLADTALVDVDIPDTVTEIASRAFLNDDKLEKVHLPASLTTMGDNVFNECSMLESVNIPDGLEVIKEGTFFNCYNLKNISISYSSKLKEIENMSFTYCRGLREIYIPVSMKKINDYSFNHTENIDKVIYCGTAEQWDQISKGEGNEHFNKYPQYHEYENGTCIYCGAESAGTTAKIEGLSASVGGNISLNVFISFEGSTDNVSVNFTLPNGAKKNISVNDAVKQADGKYVFSVDIAAQYISGNVHGEVVQGNTVLNEFDSSVEEYAKKVAIQPEYTEFIDAMVDYGTYAQSYFNNGSADPKQYTESDFQKFADAITPSSGIKDTDYVGSSLLLKSNTVLRHYFSEYKPGRTEKDGLYYIEQSFGPGAYDQKIEGFDYNIYDYIYLVLSDPNEDPALRKLCASLYEYGQAAEQLN